MSVDNLEDTMKVIIVGDGNVGKTTMLRRYVKGTYSEQYKKTIGAEFLEKSVYLKDLKREVTLMLWDTAGQEVFNAITSTYYRNAAACILCFSTIDRDSFQNVASWKKKVEAKCGGEGAIVMVLCQTKYDLESEAAMTPAEADQLAAHLRLPFIRISTKEDRNVSQLFESVAKQCVLRGVGGDMGPAIGSGGSKPVDSNSHSNGATTTANGGNDVADQGNSASTSKTAAASSSAAATAAGQSTSSETDKNGGEDGKKDKKDKKDKKADKADKNKSGDDKDKNGNNTKPIQMKEIKKKDKKKDKKGGGCVV